MTTRPEDLRIILIRSFAQDAFAPEKRDSGRRDPRWSATLDMLQQCDLNTHSENLTELRTEDRLGLSFARALMLCPELLTGKPSLFVVWSERGEESDIIAFFQALDAQKETHATVANGLIIWFRQNGQRAITHYISSRDGRQRRVYALPYRATYEDGDVGILRAILRLKNVSSATFAALRPAPTPVLKEADTTNDADVTKLAKAMTPEQALERLGRSPTSSGIKSINHVVDARREPENQEDESDRPTIKPEPIRGK